MQHIEKVQKASFWSIIIYLIAAICKSSVGILLQSSALIADGLNNFTDILASLSIFIGLKISTIPADDAHQYGHWKAESIASLISALIMLFIGFQVLMNAIDQFIHPNEKDINIILVMTSFLSGIVIFCLYRHNIKLARYMHSSGLKATAQNNLSDAMTSLLTGISMLCGLLFQWRWIDTVTAFIIALIIMKTGISIFVENVFHLSDGFDEETLKRYYDVIIRHPDVQDIRTLKARRYGANIYVDCTILVDGNMSVYQSHIVTEDIEKALMIKFNIVIVDVHVEPIR